MSGKRAGIAGEGSGQLTATLQTMAASVARIESALDRQGAALAAIGESLAAIGESLDRIRAAMAAPPSGGIDHDDAKALRRMADDAMQTGEPLEFHSATGRGAFHVQGEGGGDVTGGGLDGPCTDETPAPIDKPGESEGERVPWWRRPW